MTTVSYEGNSSTCKGYDGEVWAGGLSAIVVFYLVIFVVGAGLAGQGEAMRLPSSSFCWLGGIWGCLWGF